jgi:hypothetical protein
MIHVRTGAGRSSTKVLGIVGVLLWLLPALPGADQRPGHVHRPASEVADRTTPFLQRMTPTQRIRSRTFAQFDSGSRLLDEGVSVAESELPYGEPDPPSELEVLARVACDSAALFAGVVRSAVTNPTENGTWLFTDYEVLVEEVLRARPSIGVREGDTVVLSRVGGVLTVDGEEISATSSGYPLLQLRHRYLFAADYLSDAGSFRTSTMRRDYTFEIVDRQLTSLSPLISGPDLSLDDVRQHAALVSCR